MSLAEKRCAELVAQASARALRPPPALSPSQWAERHRVLTTEASARPGKWSFDPVPFAREPLDALADPDVHTIVLQWCSQISKSELLLNATGYFLHLDPCPILAVFPSETIAQTFSRDRLAPMLKSTPELAALTSAFRGRESDSTTLRKRVPGAQMVLVSANSTAGLASRPIKVLLCDEVDAWPLLSDGEGLSLAIQRTRSFKDRTIIIAGTPTIKGFSTVENQYLSSDQRRYLVPCPYCGDAAPLEWHRVQWDNHDATTALLVCEACKEKWTEPQRLKAIRAGYWVATHTDGEPGKRGYFINALYSPFLTIPELVALWRASATVPEKRQAFVNLQLAKSYEPPAESLDVAALSNRGESLSPIPNEYDVLLTATDVQKNRIETSVFATAPSGSIAVLEHHVISGDPRAQDVWNELDQIRRQTYERADGTQLRVAASAVDSGYLTEQVTKYTLSRSKERVFAVKGYAGGLAQPPYKPRPKRTHRGQAKIIHLNVDELKHRVHLRLTLPPESPASVRFSATLHPHYYSQLASEKLVTKFIKGRPSKYWQRLSGQLAECLDAFTYFLGIYTLLTDAPSNHARLARFSAVTVPTEVVMSPVGLAEPTRDPEPAAPTPKRDPYSKYRRGVGSHGNFGSLL